MRRTSEQLLQEFHRLYDCFEVITDCMFNADGSFWTTGGGQHIATRDGMLGWVDQKKATLSQIVTGVREALNDMSEQLTQRLEDHPDFASDALGKYRERTGRDYWDDAGHPRKLVKRILRRGHVRDEIEFRLLNSVVSDQAQKILMTDEFEKAQLFLAAFEDKAQP